MPIDHIEIEVRSIEASKSFYSKALAPLGYTLRVEGPSFGFGDGRALDFWLKPGAPSPRQLHHAFFCASRAAVRRCYRGALEGGGKKVAPPELLTRIHPHYYAAFVEDPDGHKVEFVCQSEPAARQSFIPDGAASPMGPYAHAVRAGDLLFVSGQTPIDPATGNLVSGDVTAQTERALENIAAVLAAANLDLSDVIHCGVYLVDLDDFPAMNAVYAHHFQAPMPARTTVGVKALPGAGRIEVDCVARF